MDFIVYPKMDSIAIEIIIYNVIQMINQIVLHRMELIQ